MKVFTVHGPFDVPVEKRKNGRALVDNGVALWNDDDEAGELANRCGVYVFAIRAGKGYTPIYVGKAAKQGFAKEIFTAHKQAMFHKALTDYARGTPVVFFLVHPLSPGMVNAPVIDDVETFFIDLAARKNPNIGNKRKLPVDQWGVNGVYRSGTGQRTASALAFRAVMGL